MRVSSPNKISLPAFAKINFDLRILGKRADGYHELDTIFQTISLHDTIRFSLSNTADIGFSCDDPSLPLDADNLVVRAARALQDRFAIGRGARIRLEKRIPARAGLGGGSSDAAITMVGLTHLWELAIGPEELARLSAGLGADVPFFFTGGTARGTGLGECLEPLPDAGEMFLLVVKPNAGISTIDAYQRFDERSLTTPNSKSILSTSRRSQVFDPADSASLTNDLEVVAFDLVPEIRRARTALLSAGANAALLAGSGAAMFGIFDSEDAQRRAIQAIELETGWRVFPCRTVGRSAYRSAMGPAREIFALL